MDPKNVGRNLILRDPFPGAMLVFEGCNHLSLDTNISRSAQIIPIYGLFVPAPMNSQFSLSVFQCINPSTALLSPILKLTKMAKNHGESMMLGGDLTSHKAPN